MKKLVVLQGFQTVWMKKLMLFGLLALIFLSGCRSLNPSIMLKTGKDFEYDIPPDTIAAEYQISINDMLSFRLFSNDGFQILDINAGGVNNNNAVTQQRFTQNYLVEFDGKVKLPILGRVNLEGKTIREAELFLEQEYSEYYNRPFVLMEITNRRVIVFPGRGGSAQVVRLINENTTLIEALALAGGIADIGKAHKIKLIRANGTDTPDVFLIDLSTIEGIKEGELVLQANDIIYVEPQFQLLREILQEVTPVVSLVTSAIILVSAFNSLQ